MRGWIERQGTRTSGFRYVEASGRVVRAPAVLERIEALRIPPAWRDVHIAASPRAAIQAWGIDSRGRKQYRYHPAAVEQGALRKYYRVRQMGRSLPSIRHRVSRDFRAAGFTRERVAAAAVRLLAEGFFRVGNERYTRENRSFGLTTLRKEHVTVEGDCVVFRFRGKGGIEQRRVIVDPELSRFVSRLLRAPGTRLFRYREGDAWHDLTARDVNEYLRSLGLVRCTAKDFRTWGGTLRLATVLGDLGPAASEREARGNVATAVRLVAAELGNTPAICRQSYVHPMVIAQYLDEGVTIAPRLVRHRPRLAHSPEERALLRFLDRYFPERRKRSRRKDPSRGPGRRSEALALTPELVRS